MLAAPQIPVVTVSAAAVAEVHWSLRNQKEQITRRRDLAPIYITQV